MTSWTVNNIVVHFDLHRRYRLAHRECNQYFSYEPELFPAALISRWSPAHVTLFPNGRGMITGIKDEVMVVNLLKELDAYMS